jgi:hypothetical protein
MSEESISTCQLAAQRTIADLQTRFLYPFFLNLLDRAKMQQVVSALQQATLAGCPGLWRCAAPPDLYTDEVLDHVKEYLFPAPDPHGAALEDVSLRQDGETRAERTTCGYFKIPWTVTNSDTGKPVPNPQLQSWFQRTLVHLGSDDLPDKPARLVRLLQDVSI